MMNEMPLLRKQCWMIEKQSLFLTVSVDNGLGEVNQESILRVEAVVQPCRT